jgi:16S rRNA (cytosine1407-C5)-methyltransferase
LPEGSLLVANEVIRNRSQVLAENLVKWGHPDILVSSNAPNDFSVLPAFFDVILTDVPCSGEGMFRKDEVAVADWSVDNVNICRQRQRRILLDVWPALKDGGLLVYSTCTFNKEENEENIAWIADELGAEVLDVPTEESWNITGNLDRKDFPVYRFLPYKTKGEGLFMAVLRKKESDERIVLKRRLKNDKNKKRNIPAVPSEVKAWLNDSDMFNFTSDKRVISAIRKQFSEDIMQLRQTLHVLQVGITLGTLKGKDIIPSQSLAMSTALNAHAFPVAEVDYDQAVAYLRAEAVVLGGAVPRGYVLLMYRDIPLGFVKNIGNRANNFYPDEWRIRSTYIRKTEVI